MAESFVGEPLLQVIMNLGGDWNPLYAARAQLAAGEAQYQQGVAALEQKTAEADLPGAAARIDQAWDELKNGREKLDDAWLSYEKNLQDADTGIAEGKDKLDDGQEQYAKEKADAEKKLEEGREEIETIEDARFIVENRRTNEGFVQFQAL